MAIPLPGRETRRRKWESKLLLKRFSDVFPATTAEPSRDARPKNSTPLACFSRNSEEALISSSPTQSITGRAAVPLTAVLLLAFAVHGPLLLMQLPASSYDANTHMFFAAHYAKHWFNPLNEHCYGGFSQTTYPPLSHQWIALFSHAMGLPIADMFVQLCVILLLTVGVYRFARLWVGERAARYAAVGAGVV